VTTFDPPRDLTPEERGILDFIIEANPECREALRARFAGTRVISVCPCGCGGSDLTANESALEIDGELRQAVAQVDGVVFMATLFPAVEAAGMDFDWFCDDDQRPGRLPRATELEIARWQSLPPSEGLPCQESAPSAELPAFG
jgi:hypothetical protein